MKHVILNARSKYSHIGQTYRFDDRERRSKACDALEEGAAYDLTFIMTPESKAALDSLIADVWKEAATADIKRKWPQTPSQLPYKVGENGEIMGKAKLRGAYSQKRTKPPTVVDAQKNKIECQDFELPFDSLVNVAVTIVAYNTGAAQGVSLRLGAIQVLEMGERADDVPFDVVTGYVAKTVPMAAPPTQDFNEEIPF
ncbi:MAG: DUF2815 family protein [Candidatus Diapherotrites archaeon]|nr:DUF2815 family protein [Candidatus Diapherotrites archaeon]